MSKLSLISITLGVMLLGAAGYMAYSQQQSLSSGVQIEATVESKEVTMSSSKKGDKYTPNVTYSYTYNGTRYTSDNIRPGIGTKASNTRTAAEDRIDQYNVGETTTAYVVQGSPSKSYLKKKSGPLPIILGILGLALIGRPVYKSVAS
jgi:Tfp pilus assembly protein PilV